VNEIVAVVARIVLAYDGTDFHGWQVQPDLRTVQGELARAVGRLVPLTEPPPGAGRTDAGVHARGQVASVPLAGAQQLSLLARALPRLVPADMAVLEVAARAPGFHARFSATARRYTYRMLEVADPLRRRDHWRVRPGLNWPAMQSAAPLLVGDHDCTSFCRAASAEPGRMRCVVRNSELSRGALPGSWEYTVEADRFVHSMVRTIVGTLLEIGAGRRAPESISDILAARDRRAAGATAPPHGLCLEQVEYASADSREAGQAAGSRAQHRNGS
jgi:tRNA pseudouridine38-40 synthase